MTVSGALKDFRVAFWRPPGSREQFETIFQERR
jgi:hypothetical protein